VYSLIRQIQDSPDFWKALEPSAIVPTQTTASLRIKRVATTDSQFSFGQQYFLRSCWWWPEGDRETMEITSIENRKGHELKYIHQD
jgi:hypothetical protein